LQGKPKLTVEEPMVDFGAFYAGKQIDHTFKIANKGDGDLHITRIYPGCGCTVTGKYPNLLKPGESAEVPFTMNTAAFRGPFAKTPTIYSDDPTNPQFRLTMKGEAKRYIDVTRTGVEFENLIGDQPKVRTVEIINNTETPLKLTLQPESASVYKFELKEKLPGKTFELKVTASPPWGEPGVRQAQFKVLTNLEQEKEIDFNVTAFVPVRIEVVPSTIRIHELPQRANSQQTVWRLEGGPQETPRMVKRMVRFTSHTERPIKVTEVSVTDPSLSASFKEYGPSTVVEVLMPTDYVPPADCKIIIKTDDTEKPIVEVPIESAIPQQVAPAPPARAPSPPPPPPPSIIAPPPPPPATKAPPPSLPKPAEMLVGRDIPAFKLTSESGKEVSNQNLGAPVVVLNFFSPRCGYCRRQMPMVEKVRPAYEAKGVRFIYVSQAMGSEPTKEDCTKMMSEIGVKGDWAMDPGNKIGRDLFKATGFPTMVILDKSGKIAAVNIGARMDLEQRMKGQLDALLAGKAIPPELLPEKPTPEQLAQIKEQQLQQQRQQQQAPTPLRPAEMTVGQPTPAFKLTSESGKEVSNENLGAPVVVLDFFSPRCGFCKRQMPVVEKIRSAYEAKGVRFLYVSQAMGSEPTKDDVTKMLSEIKVAGDFAMDPGNKIGRDLFKATTFPTMVILDKSGKIAAVNVGARADLEERMKGQLEALLAGKAIPPELLPQKPTPEQLAQLQRPQAPSPPRPAEMMVGQPIPAFKLTSESGKEVSNQNLGAPVVVLDFFSPRCGFCKRQMPVVEKIRSAYEAKGVRFLYVSQAMGAEPTKDDCTKMMSEIEVTGDLAMDPGNKIGRELFKAMSYPTMVILDKSGKIAAVNVGARADLEERTKGQLEALLAGKAIPPELLPPKPPAAQAAPNDDGKQG
jgi:thiol-disulfide isomerase/thioredoxin